MISVKKVLFQLVIISLLSTITHPTHAGTPSPLDDPDLTVDLAPKYVPNEIIVRLTGGQALAARKALKSKPDAPLLKIGNTPFDTIGEELGLQSMHPIFSYPNYPKRELMQARFQSEFQNADHFYRLRFVQGVDPIQAVARYSPIVSHAQLNHIYSPDLAPNDPRYQNNGQPAHQATQAELGWDIETGRQEIRIAIIGTGVEMVHPDLIPNLGPGWDVWDQDNDPSPPTGASHETLVAGVAAAATNNGIGVAGACWNCTIVPVRIGYTSAHVAEAIVWASDPNGGAARVINMSFGNYDPTKYGPNDPDLLVSTAVDQAYALGTVMVATAGNNSISTKRYPAAYDKVIATAATDFNDNRTGFSNFGSWVTVAAPGAGILSTTLNGQYAAASGTSFAAPYVAGLAGLLLSINESLSPQEVIRFIEYTADTLETDRYIGPRINVQRSLEALHNTGTPPLYAQIKSPETNDPLYTGQLEIVGTAWGDRWVLDYRPVGSANWTTVANQTNYIENEVLATVDQSTFPSSGVFELRLTAYGQTSSASHILTIWVAPENFLQAGWPVNVDSPILGAPSYADIDGDGDQEIFFGTNSGDVHAYHHDGTPLAGNWPVRSYGPYIYSSPALGDIDGDGDQEIVFGNYGGFYIHAYHHNGAPVAGWPKATSDGMRGDVALVNLDENDDLEVIAAVTSGDIYIWKGNGALMPGWPVQLPNNVQSSPAVGDIDGDNDLEIIIRQYEGIYAYHHNGVPVAGWPLALERGHDYPVLLDL